MPAGDMPMMMRTSSSSTNYTGLVTPSGAGYTFRAAGDYFEEIKRHSPGINALNTLINRANITTPLKEVEMTKEQRRLVRVIIADPHLAVPLGLDQ